MDEDKFLIHVKIAEKEYELWINRNEEEEQLVRDAAKQIQFQMIRYRQAFSGAGVDLKDLLAMVALQLSIENLRLEKKNDTAPFAEKIEELTNKLESYLKDE